MPNAREDRHTLSIAVVLMLAAQFMVMYGIYSTPRAVVNAQRAWDTGEAFQCGGDGIGATLTRICQAPPIPQKMAITDMYTQSTTGTAGQFILRIGDSPNVNPSNAANCGTNTQSILPSQATAVRYNYPLFSGAGSKLNWQTPIVIPPGKDLCALGVATNLLVIEITGRLFL